MKKIIVFFGVASSLLFWGCAYAHQPNIVTQSPVLVSDPEISKAFYDTLQGSPRMYVIESKEDFEFYAGLLVPKEDTAEKFSAHISRIDEETRVASLDGDADEWEVIYEPFGADWYFKGPEFGTRVPAGTYAISVFNEKNEGKYVLAIGGEEKFGFMETIRATWLLPKLKIDFFGKSAISIFISPIGILGSIVFLAIMFGIWKIIFVLAARYVGRDEAGKFEKNTGKKDRIVRLILGGTLFIGGTAFWNIPVLIFGTFVLYEAFTGWCGLYALIGKNTCAAE